MNGNTYRYPMDCGEQLRLAGPAEVEEALKTVSQMFTKEELRYAAQEKDRV
jgi:hypothetical protein